MADPAKASGRPPFRAVIWGWILFVAVETVTQVVFKLAGAAFDDRLGLAAVARNAAASPMVWAGFILYFSGFLIWMTILKDADVGRAFPMTATIYLAGLATAVLFFHEHINPTRIVGVLVIIAGVALMASEADTPAATGPLPEA